MTMSNGNLSIDDVQGGTVYDSTGDKVGKVSSVYLDDSTGQPAFATVSTGLLGTRESFVPLRGATVRGDEIHVPYSKDMIKDAPSIDADAHVSEAEEAELFRYYDDQGSSSGDWGSESADRDRSSADAMGAGTTGTHGTDGVDSDHETMVRREEQLNVGTERVESGRLRIRKHVVTEHETVTVPVEREEVEIVREPVSGTSTGRTGDLGDDEIEVTLSEERPVVDKQVVDAERIGVDRRTVADTETVQADVAREEIDIDREGDTRR